MRPTRWDDIKRIYAHACTLGPDACDGFVREACAHDPVLEDVVVSLLRERVDVPRFDSPVAPIDWTDKVIGHFRVVRRIGAGGMGVVYAAEDLRLGRRVALKFLAPHLDLDEAAKRRLEREGRAAAAIDHPNVCSIHEVGDVDGHLFLAMPLVDGRTLGATLKARRLTVGESVGLAVQLAEGVRAAHARGVIHRDIKSSNVMIEPSGCVKILDFGLARSPGDGATRSGALMGTPAYMSPEQALGAAVDARTDIWSLGVLLHEMLSGTTPFRGDSEFAILRAILEEAPAPLPPAVVAEAPALQRVVARALAKDPDARYQHVDDLIGDLQTLETSGTDTLATTGAVSARSQWRPSLGRWRRPATVAALVAVIAVVALTAILTRDAMRTRWARSDALPQIEQLDANGRRYDAFDLAQRARPYLEGEPAFEVLWSRIAVPLTVETEPAGARVFVRRPGEHGEGGEHGEWEAIGASPVHGSWLPASYVHVRAEYPDRAPVERSVDLSEAGTLRWSDEPTLTMTLPSAAGVPDDMVLVPGGQASVNRLFFADTATLRTDDFLLDRYEVTNRDYLAFVQAGGYTRREFWTHAMRDNGVTLSWAQAMDRFRDATGRPGPSTWELGRYREGEADFPVGGVSWFEAEAYAAYAGKALPTIYHWNRAAAAWSTHWGRVLGNFGGRGPRATRASQSMSRFGVYDAAGNVAEWSRSAVDGAGTRRFVLGGGWADAEYMFREPAAPDVWERRPMLGFRCMRELGPTPTAQALAEPLRIRRRDYSRSQPANDDEFVSLLRRHAYEEGPLESVVEQRDASARWWRYEKVSFAAAYGDERVVAHLFLPLNVKPPYQTVVVFPGADAVFRRSSDALPSTYSGFFSTFLARAGRAVVYPVYSGFYERGGPGGPEPGPSAAWRDLVIRQTRDLGRTVDYLATRDDVDASTLTYFGLSLGAWLSPVMLTTERRFSAAVLSYGGLIPVDLQPEVDPFNFAPRVTLPVLVINGRDDHVFPLRESQEPFFQLLGTPPALKQRVLLEGGHSVPQHALIRETLQWLDERLGPAQAARPAGR